MLGSADSPYIVSLMRLIETQSKATLCKWCVDYAEEFYLPIYLKSYPNDTQLQGAINAARARMRDEVTIKQANEIIFACCKAALEIDENPAARAAARAVGQSASSSHSATHSLSVIFYGAAAVAYDRVGLAETAEVYDKIAAEECAKYEAALRKIAVENEPNRANINWNC